MEQIKALDLQLEKIRTQRAKLERKAKLREARDLQTGVLKSKTLEKELKIIKKDNLRAKEFNRQFLYELNLVTTRHTVSDDKFQRRLKEAKVEFAQMIMSEFPTFASALKEPISFQKQAIEQGIQDIRKRRVEEEALFQHHQELHSQITAKRQELVQEVEKQNLLQIERERRMLQAKQEDEANEAHMIRIKAETNYLRTQMLAEEQLRTERHRQVIKRPESIPLRPESVPLKPVSIPLSKPESGAVSTTATSEVNTQRGLEERKWAGVESYIPEDIEESIQDHQRLEQHPKRHERNLSQDFEEIDAANKQQAPKEIKENPFEVYQPESMQVDLEIDVVQKRNKPQVGKGMPEYMEFTGSGSTIGPEVSDALLKSSQQSTDRDASFNFNEASAAKRPPLPTTDLEISGAEFSPPQAQSSGMRIHGPGPMRVQDLELSPTTEDNERRMDRLRTLHTTPPANFSEVPVVVDQSHVPVIVQVSQHSPRLAKPAQDAQFPPIVEFKGAISIPTESSVPESEMLPFDRHPDPEGISKPVQVVLPQHSVPIVVASSQEVPIAGPIPHVVQQEIPVVVQKPNVGIIQKQTSPRDELEQTKHPDQRSPKRLTTPYPVGQPRTPPRIEAPSISSDRPPLSPSSASAISTSRVEPGLISNSDYIQNMKPNVRQEFLLVLMRSAEARFMATQTQIETFDESITIETLEATTRRVVELMKKKENLRDVLRNVSLNEIVMIMFLLLKEHPFPVYPVEVSRKKRIPKEAELVARLNPQVTPIYNELRKFLQYLITENFLNRDTAVQAFTDSLLNYSTSRNQLKRTEQFVKDILPDNRENTYREMRTSMTESGMSQVTQSDRISVSGASGISLETLSNN